MTDQPVEEVADRRSEGLRLAFELLHGLGQAVGHPDVAALQLAHELDVVVSRQAERGARLGHAHDEAQHGRRVGAAVDVVADEHRPPARRRGDGHRAGIPVAVDAVAEPRQERNELPVGGIAEAARSGRSLQVPAITLLKTLTMATERKEEATYGRSLTYSRARSGPRHGGAGPGRPDRSRAAVPRCSGPRWLPGRRHGRCRGRRRTTAVAPGCLWNRKPRSVAGRCVVVTVSSTGSGTLSAGVPHRARKDAHGR